MVACPACHASYPDGVSECPEDGTALLPEEALASIEPLLAPGTMAGEYRVDKKLGAGTFGAVYAGEQPLIGKKVAIKVLHRKFSSDPEVVSRFIAEARAVNRIRHRNIIDIFSFGLLPDRQHYFVMELLDGLTLGELLQRQQRLSVARALPILQGIAAGLDAAHEAGVTHRDLKPDNVFLAAEKDGAYFPKLLDFGVAKLVTEQMAHKTATGVAIGTPRYMSPEQWRGKKIDHRADVYALGAVIHEMLTGRALFDGESVMDLFVKQATEPPPPMSSVCADLPPELDGPVLAMVAKRPNARPASAGAGVAALVEVARALGLDSEEAPRLKPDAAARRPAERSRVANATTAEVRLPSEDSTVEVSSSNTAAAVTGERSDEDPASVRTEVAPEDRAAPTVAAAPLFEAARPASGDAAAAAATAPEGVSSHVVPPRPRSLWVLIAAIAAGVALGVIAFRARSGTEPAPAAIPATIAPPESAASVTSASIDPEPPPIVQTAPSAAPPLLPTPAPDAGAPAGTQRRKPPLHKDLEKPAELSSPTRKGAP